ncbi:hypothetical protein EW145_g957 [Phellinidium pouzarii]|uniref:YABBY protein C-terminal domain-containing protein n=1 Tax=Phellinidium pouzarii TaxID=167371 RepID=A0A4S4LGA6_9AGAM|nr:hypothetical protein EW145_g957 [Phellinidium pouzarii]
MVRGTKAGGTEKPAKKAKSSGGAKGKGKITPYNRYMREELARLKESDPEMKHPERFKIAATNWANAIENPKNKAK